MVQDSNEAFRVLTDVTVCIRCGGRTYTWGMPLPGQGPRDRGEYDDRERTHRTCVKCGHTVPPARKA